MRPTTEVAIKFESVGKPEFNHVTEVMPLSQALLEIAKWLATTHMGSKIRITMARTTRELESRNSVEAAGADMAALFEQMNQIANSGDEDESE